mgnify:FL=1
MSEAQAACRIRSTLRSYKAAVKSLDYTQQLNLVDELFRLLAIITRKKTHAFRVGAAQWLDSAG